VAIGFGLAVDFAAGFVLFIELCELDMACDVALGAGEAAIATPVARNDAAIIDANIFFMKKSPLSFGVTCSSP